MIPRLPIDTRSRMFEPAVIEGLRQQERAKQADARRFRLMVWASLIAIGLGVAAAVAKGLS